MSLEDIKHLNSLIICKEIKTVIKSLPKKKGANGFTAKFYHTSKELTAILQKLFQEIEREKTLQTHSMKPALHSFQSPMNT
jgi:predicted transcriptional regulator